MDAGTGRCVDRSGDSLGAAVSSCRLLDIFCTENPGHHRDPRTTRSANYRDILRHDSADCDAGDPSRQRGDPPKPRLAERRAGVRLGHGGPPGTDSPIVGAAGHFRFDRRADRGAQEKPGGSGAPREPHREVVGTEVHARRTNREGHVEAVVDQHRYGNGGDELPRQHRKLPRGAVLESKLDAGHSTVHRGAAPLDQFVPGHQAVVRHQHQPKSLGYIHRHATNHIAGPMTPGDRPRAVVSRRGAARWREGHPWIYASDVLFGPEQPGLVAVQDEREKFLGQALCSPRSEIRLRLLEKTDGPVDAAWWTRKLGASLARRADVDATAYRVVHGEGDGLPSLIVDRYDRCVVVQLLSAGLETMRDDVLAAIHEVLAPEGILLRNDVSVRRHEGLPERVELVHGTVPEEIVVREGEVRYIAAPWTGQKTGAFLDQRPNRIRAAELAVPGGDALDCFTYHGSFALHLARKSREVVALDSSAEALARGASNAELNGVGNIRWETGDAFEVLRAMVRAKARFETIVVDPPAFAKSKSALAQAIRGYHEINLRAMKLLAPGGVLLTASCSFHLRRPQFLEMIVAAARDSGRVLTVVEHLGQGIDHPELVTVPETGYLKGVVLRAAGAPETRP